MVLNKPQELIWHKTPTYLHFHCKLTFGLVFKQLLSDPLLSHDSGDFTGVIFY